MKESTRVREKLGGGYAGIHSVEVAAEILLQLANFRQPTSLKTLSDLCRLTPSKVHRYLSSMAKLGLVMHGKKSGNYALGRNAIMIGLAAMQQSDRIDEVIEELPELVAKVKCHVGLSVWSKAGPTIIKWEWSHDPLVIGQPLGQVLPVLHSASGMVFVAFLPPAQTHDLIAAELKAYGDYDKYSEKNLQSNLDAVRAGRYAVSRGEVESDITAIAMPVVDWDDNAVVVVEAIVSKNVAGERITSILAHLAKFCDQVSVHRPTFKYAHRESAE